VKLAVQQEPFILSLSYVLPEFKENSRFLMDVLTVNSEVYHYLPKKLATNIDFLVVAIDKNPNVYLELSPEMKNELTRIMKRSLSELTQLELTDQLFKKTKQPMADLGPAGLSIQAHTEQFLTKDSERTRVVGDGIVRAPRFSNDTVRRVSQTIRKFSGGKRTKTRKQTKRR
jgi:hypothetical protein